MAALTQSIILHAAAKGGCVIVGRGAQCVLQNCRGALHVFVYALWSERVARLQARVRAGAENVEELVRSTDTARAAYIRRHFGCNWKDPALYQLMVSSDLGVDNVAGAIVDVVESAELATLYRSFNLPNGSMEREKSA